MTSGLLELRWNAHIARILYLFQVVKHQVLPVTPGIFLRFYLSFMKYQAFMACPWHCICPLWNNKCWHLVCSWSSICPSWNVKCSSWHLACSQSTVPENLGSIALIPHSSQAHVAYCMVRGSLGRLESFWLMPAPALEMCQRWLRLVSWSMMHSKCMRWVTPTSFKHVHPFVQLITKCLLVTSPDLR